MRHHKRSKQKSATRNFIQNEILTGRETENALIQEPFNQIPVDPINMLDLMLEGVTLNPMKEQKMFT